MAEKPLPWFALAHEPPRRADLGQLVEQASLTISLGPRGSRNHSLLQGRTGLRADQQQKQIERQLAWVLLLLFPDHRARAVLVPRGDRQRGDEPIAGRGVTFLDMVVVLIVPVIGIRKPIRAAPLQRRLGLV